VKAGCSVGGEERKVVSVVRGEEKVEWEEGEEDEEGGAEIARIGWDAAGLAG
jgi:hypothetical protein